MGHVLDPQLTLVRRGMGIGYSEESVRRRDICDGRLPQNAPTLGLKPYNPVTLWGIRTLPPISVPIPRIEPCKANNEPSPPVEPPGEN